MSSLFETDSRLQAILDKQSQRNLLDPSNLTPFSVDLTGGKPVRFALQIVNGPEGLIDLSIAADQGWLEPETKRLTLVGSEKGECVVSARPDGAGEFGNLLFSWEGTQSTQCQSVMIMRKQGAVAPPPAGDKSQPPGPPVVKDNKQQIAAIKKYIEGCAPDKFIDYEEEQRIFRKGGDLEFSLTEVESVLHGMCKDGGWTRETRLRETLKAQLIEATKDDGVVDKKELEGAVAFAVNRKMPRKEALELCVTIMLDNNLKPAKAGFFGGTIIDGYRKQFGL